MSRISKSAAAAIVGICKVVKRRKDKNQDGETEQESVDENKSETKDPESEPLESIDETQNPKQDESASLND